MTNHKAVGEFVLAHISIMTTFLEGSLAGHVIIPATLAMAQMNSVAQSALNRANTFGMTSLRLLSINAHVQSATTT